MLELEDLDQRVKDPKIQNEKKMFTVDNRILDHEYAHKSKNE